MAVATKTTRTQAESDIQAVGGGSLADGAVVGPYQVVRFLGRGGMGEVYEALHTLLGKRFALKLISKELSQDEKARELFRREGREAGNLDHPNIVRVDDCGEVDGRMYLRMELIEGRPCRGDTCITLTDYIIACQRRVPPDEAIPILHDILRGLTYAHSRRRVHRDIKPSNILMTPAAAKIGDFGLVMSGARPGGDISQTSEVVVMGLGAQSMMNATQASGASAAAGTPDYMAPELLSGSVEANYSTDVYSVGILLLEMLTGSRRVGAAKPSQLLRSYYKLAPWWDQLYERSTAYHEDRFANARDMLGFFIEVSGLAKAQGAPEVEAPRAGSGPATTRVPANWGNAPAAAPAAPPAPEPPPVPKAIPDPPRVAPPPVAPPSPAPRRVPAPEPSATSSPAPGSPEPDKAGRRVPWVPIGAGGVVLLGASLYLATRTHEKPANGNTFQPPKPPAAEPTAAAPQKGGANVTPPKPAVATEKVEPAPRKPQAAPVVVGNGAASGSKGPTNAPKPRLVQQDQQDDVRRQREESAVTEALRNGRLEEAWKLVSQKDSLVDKALRESVVGAHLAAERVAEGLRSGNVERLKESLVAWQKAKPAQMADPEVIRSAQKSVEQSTSEGERQRAWREQVRSAIGAEDVPGIRRLLAEKRYETDPARALGEKALQKAEATSEGLLGQAREALKKGDLAAARLARESLNQHLVRTKQEPDSQLAGEIASAQRAIQERKVEKAVDDLGRYTGGETPPVASTDPEVSGNPRYQAALQSAQERQAAWKAANLPKPVAAVVPTPDPVASVPAPKTAAKGLDPALASRYGLAGRPSEPQPTAGNTTLPQTAVDPGSAARLGPKAQDPQPQSVPQVAAPSPATTAVAASADKGAFETLKNRIKRIGNATIPNKTKQDMMSFLQSYQKDHPEDAKEASRLIENLRNR